MLCEAASTLGVETVVLAGDPEDAATQVAGSVELGRATDSSALAVLASRCDVVTFDHELVDLDGVRALEVRGAVVRPSARALQAAADKAHQRRAFAAAGIPVPAFAILDCDEHGDLAALRDLARACGRVPVVKSARGGYDGRGVVVATTLEEAEAAVRAWRAEGVVVVAEAPCDEGIELAALVARRPGGEVASWRPVETTQVGGVCREVRVPGRVGDDAAAGASALARRVADELGVVGVLAVECFETSAGPVVNEVATRPHNSGHWTIEGARTSQFENHLRAILDLPLGSTELLAPTVASVNVFGGEGTSPSLEAALAEPSAKVHLYGKASRPGRKLGHVTVTGTDPDDVAARAWRTAAALGTPVPADAAARS